MGGMGVAMGCGLGLQLARNISGREDPPTTANGNLFGDLQRVWGDEHRTHACSLLPSPPVVPSTSWYWLLLRFSCPYGSWHNPQVRSM